MPEPLGKRGGGGKVKRPYRHLEIARRELHTKKSRRVRNKLVRRKIKNWFEGFQEKRPVRGKDQNRVRGGKSTYPQPTFSGSKTADNERKAKKPHKGSGKLSGG